MTFDMTQYREAISRQEEVVDAVINELGSSCSLEYAPSFSYCPNCHWNPVTKKSSGRYQSGGPMPFDFGRICPYCKGAGRIKSVDTDSITLQIYYESKDWERLPLKTTVVDGLVLVKGFMTDVEKFNKAKRIYLNITVDNIQRSYVAAEPAIPVGFRRDRYFTCFVKPV